MLDTLVSKVATKYTNSWKWVEHVNIIIVDKNYIVSTLKLVYYNK